MLDHYGRIALKRGLRRAAIMLTVALSPTVTLAQTELPSNADALFLEFFSAPNIGCFAYPLGKVQLLVGENGGPAPTDDFNRDMLAFEKKWACCESKKLMSGRQEPPHSMSH